MNRRMNSLYRAAFALGGAAIFVTLPGVSRGQNVPNVPINIKRDVGLDQKLNAQVPLNDAFRDSTGNLVQLRAFFGRKPVILMMPFYQCPGICTLELDGLLTAFRSGSGLGFKVGDEFNTITVSINPKEGPAIAAAKKREYMDLLNQPQATGGWSFLTGTAASIKELANAVGFRYVYDPKTDQYAHPAGIMVITPEGKVSRYFYGVTYPTRDLRLSIVEASAHKIGTPVDSFLLLCYHYDPVKGRYGLAIMNILRLAGGLTVLAVGSFMFLMFRRERVMGPHRVDPPAAGSA